MKKILFIGIFALVSNFGFSQQGEPESQTGRHQKITDEQRLEMRQEMRKKMAEKLSLTEAQTKQINAIDEKYKNQEDILRKESDEIREKRWDLMDKKREEIEKVLTNEQKTKLTEMRDGYKGKHSYRRGHCGRGYYNVK